MADHNLPAEAARRLGILRELMTTTLALGDPAKPQAVELWRDMVDAVLGRPRAQPERFFAGFHVVTDPSLAADEMAVVTGGERRVFSVTDVQQLPQKGSRS